MSDPTILDPISIKTVDEANQALKRAKGSFEEWLECARIFSANRMWDQLEKAAQKALESATRRPLKATLLKEAAMRFAAGSLKEFHTKEEFKQNCEETSDSLSEFNALLNKDSESFKTYFESVIEALDEISLLLADGSPQALTSISSRLRKRLGRADLAVAVANVAINIDSKEYAAFTTRGAAFSELSEYERALSDFLFAEGDKQSRPYAIAGHTKLLIRQSHFRDAIDVGWELLKSGKNKKSILFLLAAAAKGAGDEEKFKWLVKEAESLTEVIPGSGKVLLTKQAIKILIENKQFDVADKLLVQYSEIASENRYKALRKEYLEAKRLQDIADRLQK